MRRKDLVSYLIFVVILIFFCSRYYHDMVHRKPSGIHDWAQADRLALAMSFYDNGMNFFKPATFDLHSKGGVAGVEFPITAYLAALAGKLGGRSHISTFYRLIDILIGCAGLLFLFGAMYKRTRDFLFSVFIPLFVFSAPVFIYYTCNYIPDAPALAIVFIAFYYMLDYMEEKKDRQLVAALAFFTLATLIKTSIGLYLACFAGYEIIQRLYNRNKRTAKSNLLFVSFTLLSFGIIISYFLYNQYLNKKYNSDIFLATVKPFKSLADIRNFFDISFKLVWMKEYLLLPQYLILALVIILSPSFGWKDQNSKGKILVFIFLIGALTVGYLMGGQLFDHDYYVLSIFYPLMVYAMLISVLGIYRRYITSGNTHLWKRGIGVTIVVVFVFASIHQHQRLLPDYYPFETGKPWALDKDVLLDSLQIPRSEKILALNENPPNLALVLLDRKGYHLPGDRWTNGNQVIQFMKDRHLKIVACNLLLGKHMVEVDTILRKHFVALAMQDRIAVLRLVSESEK